mgnify:CR=1 FL=1
MLFTACEDDYDKLVKEPNDVTLNELQLEKFTHIIPDGGFKSGEITFNTKKNSDGTFSGFAYSRRSNRSFTWSGTDAALDSNRFSDIYNVPSFKSSFKFPGIGMGRLAPFL